MELMKAAPTFWRVSYPKNSDSAEVLTKQASPYRQAVFDRIIGVLSGHFGGVIDASNVALSTSEKSYRTRGLWVSPEARRSGVAKLLMTAAFEQARREGCSTVWTFPRESSMPFYSSMGFTQVGAMIGINDPLAGEFGPNSYAIAKL